MDAAVGTDLQHARLLQHPVFAREGNAAAEAARAGAPGQELVAEDLDRLLGLGDLDRRAGHVGEHVRIAVEPVRPRAPAPGAAGEVDIDEGLALRVVAADGHAGIPAIPRRAHAVGQHQRQRAEQRIHHAEPREAARRDGGGQHGMGDGAGRGDHLDGAEISLVVRDAGRQDGPDRAVGRAARVGEGAVDRALHLRGGTGPVHHDPVAALRHAHAQRDRLAGLDAVVVDSVLEGPFAVRQLAQRRAREAFAVVQQFLHEEARAVRAMLRDQVPEGAVRDGAGGQLRAQVPHHLVRHAHIALEEQEEGLVRPAALEDAHGRDAQALLVDLGAVRCVGPRDAPAHIRVVADRRGEGQAHAIDEQGPEDEDVGQVHPALEGVVEREDVALRHVVPVFADDGGECLRDRPEVGWQGQPLRDQPALPVAEGGRVVHVVLEHRGIGRAVDRQRHLVGDGEQRVLEQLEGDGIVAAVGHAMLPRRRGCQPAIFRRGCKPAPTPWRGVAAWTTMRA